MTFNCLKTDREDIGNFLVSVPFGDKFDDGFLARREDMIGGSAGFFPETKRAASNAFFEQ
jgi:hypothetical protein